MEPVDCDELLKRVRGLYCILSIQAVEMLRAMGFNAVRLEEGIQDLRAVGFPLAGDQET